MGADGWDPESLDFFTFDQLQQQPVANPAQAALSTSTGFIPGTATGQYIQTPQAQAALGLLWPGLTQLGTALETGGGLYNVPNIPSVTNAPMPTQGWFSGLDSSIQSGLLEPYTLASKQLAEQLGAGGMAGSARGGWSGTAGTALSDFWEQAGQGMGTQAWNMINPNAMAQWQATNAAAQNQWTQQVQANMLPWATFPSLLSQAMPTPYIQQGTSGGGKK